MAKIAILGPEYSYSHVLALKAFPNEEYLFCKTIPDVFESVSNGKSVSGLVPIENMFHGTVRESLISLQKYKVKINRALDLPIRMCIASKSDNYKIITSKQEALSQCSKFLAQTSKQVQDASSTSLAMEMASKDEKYAAIGSEEAALKLGLKILKKNIEDNSDNVTRFILISRKESEKDSGNARTSMMIIPKKDKPGLLYEILSVFKIKEINLTKIESIPTGKKLGEYEFFIEIDGNMNNENVKTALSFLRTMHEIYFFGSYRIENVY